jgi:hypothetical protein
MEYVGLSLELLLDHAWHAKNKNQNAARSYFGFDTLDEFLVHVDVMLPDTYHFPDLYDTIEAAENELDLIAYEKAAIKLDKAAQLKVRAATLCVLRMRMNMTMVQLEHVSGWGHDKVSNLWNFWMPRIGDASRFLVNMPMPLDLGRELMPEDFIDGPLDDVFLIGDGKDCPIHEPRKAHQTRQHCFSSKMKCACLRGMSFMHPCGCYNIVFDMCLAKASEPALVRAFASRFDWLPPQCGVLYDKGIKGNLRQVFKNLNPIYVPNFRKSKDYLYTADEVADNREFSRLRYSVEVGYSRVAHYRYIGERMTFHKLRHANDVWHYSHYHANLMLPLRT